jgi:gamma-glutamyltranspeptidase/glutathione hydrolase
VTAPTISTATGDGGIVSAADAAAAAAGAGILAAGGNAVDAVIATNAAMAIVAPHQCGMGGDLFALVHHDGATSAVNASGRAGSGADPDRLRAAGHTEMPFRHGVDAVTVPGCVDGWMALHARFATLPLAQLLAPAIALAEGGFEVSPLLDVAYGGLDGQGHEALTMLAPLGPGADRLTRRGAGRALRSIAARGRDGFYGAEFGEGLLALGAGLFSSADLERSQADWVTPLSTTAFGLDLHTIPPNSQGYLALAGLMLAEQVGLPDDPDDPEWAHVLIECATAAGHDRVDALHDGADGGAVLAAACARRDLVDRSRASNRWAPGRDGDTTYMCVVDSAGMGVSLIQSNAAGFGSWLAEPHTGINLHNRGIGFNLIAGHPAEYRPGRRPPHTLSPLLASRGGRLVSVLGTMGGDAQPQILMQLAARLFHHDQPVPAAMAAGRWALTGPVTGFDTWTSGVAPTVEIEGQAPAAWASDLAARGHRVQPVGSYASKFGHAHAIVVDESGTATGAADPRTVVGACLGVDTVERA